MKGMSVDVLEAFLDRREGGGAGGREREGSGAGGRKEGGEGGGAGGRTGEGRGRWEERGRGRRWGWWEGGEGSGAGGRTGGGGRTEEGRGGGRKGEVRTSWAGRMRDGGTYMNGGRWGGSRETGQWRQRGVPRCEM